MLNISVQGNSNTNSVRIDKIPEIFLRTDISVALIKFSPEYF